MQISPDFIVADVSVRVAGYSLVMVSKKSMVAVIEGPECVLMEMWGCALIRVVDTEDDVDAGDASNGL